MSKFDDFIEATDKDLDVDTSTRSSEGCLTPPTLRSPTVPVAATFQASKGTKLHPHQRQVTPKKMANQEHPLKDVAEGEPPTSIRSMAQLNKRRSLIQPIVAPKTPESADLRVKGIHINRSAPPKLLVDKRERSRHIRTYSRSSSKSPSRVSEDSNDISFILQKLANKELELLEGKCRIEELKKKLASEEQSYKEKVNELEQLKDFVGARFQNENNEISEASAPVAALSISEENAASHQLDTKSSPQESVKDNQSVWSKPLAILNQFDQMIQQELERTLNWEESAGQQPNSNSITDSGRDRTSAPVRQPKVEESSVTRSIWNFVHDVKAGLLGVEEEVQYSSAKPQEARESSEGTVGPAKLDIKEFKRVSAIQEASDSRQGTNKLRFVDGVDRKKREEQQQASHEVEMREL